jgi:hypothetical protein
MFRGRIAGHEYVIQVVGWWLWYAAIVAVVTTLLVLAVS